MENKEKNGGIPTFDMIPMLMANLLEDNRLLSTKLDAIDKMLLASMGNNSKNDDQRMDVTEAQKYIPGHPAVQTIYG